LQRKLILSLLLLSVLVTAIVVFLFLRTPLLGNLENLFIPYDPSKNPVNIHFKYGVGGKNELNTFNGTFTKDLVIDGTITTRLTLTPEELSQIQERLSDIGFFDYPETFPSQLVVTPRGDYYLKVQNGSTVKEVTWYSDSQLDPKTDADLSQLCSLITDMIEEKLEYKLLPPPNGAYQ
jgi:hypothetical protein